MIIASAILYKGFVFTSPNPGRHHNVIRKIVEVIKCDFVQSEAINPQGFIDEHGNFLNRKEGAAYAIKCKQIEKLKWPPDLYSEDLW